MRNIHYKKYVQYSDTHIKGQNLELKKESENKFNR